MLLFPHAKINIGLDIIGRLPDGYHSLETVMIPTDWEDILELTPAAGEATTLTVSGRTVDCPPEKNLVMKAYNALAATVGGLPPTNIHLHKIVPDGAGLGGGSADAAFTIRGLNELYNLGLPDEILAETAAGIGADCPFFIYDRPMLCTGTGTEMAPVELPRELNAFTLAIVKPPVGVSTAEAYRGVAVARPALSLAERVSRSVEDWQASVHNAFEESVVPKCPRIGEIKARMLALGAVYASMSGSGSAVYGFFPQVDSDVMADMLKNTFDDCDVHVCRKMNVFVENNVL